MAKTKSVIQFSGTVLGITHVHSKAYGNHVRAIRGTHTPITLSDGMKESSFNQAQANKMAKIIFDTSKDFAPGFKDGRFWTRLVSVFRQQKKAGKDYHYSDFDLMDMRRDYAMSKLGMFSLTAGLNETQHLLLHYNLKPDMPYRLSLLRMATDETLLNPFPNEIKEITVNARTKIGTAEFDFTPLPANSSVLYALKCEPIENGKITNSVSGKSVRFYT